MPGLDCGAEPLRGNVNDAVSIELDAGGAAVVGRVNLQVVMEA